MQPITIGILGDLKETYEPHYVMTKVFRDMQQHIPFEFLWVPTESLIQDAPETLSRYPSKKFAFRSIISYYCNNKIIVISQ